MSFRRQSNASRTLIDVVALSTDTKHFRVAWRGPPSPGESDASSDSSDFEDSAVVPVSWTKSLLDLDDDSLYLVIVALCENVEDSKNSKGAVLAPLSLACKRLRELTVPFMFREGRSSAGRRVKSASGRTASRSRSLGRSSICRLFKTFEVDHDETGDLQEELAQTIPALARMANLTTLIITMLHLESHELIAAVAQIPTLTTLILNISRMDTTEPLPLGRISKLENVIIREGLWPMKRAEAQRVLERANVSSLILSNHLTLRYLEVPAGITDLFQLGSLEWPHLNHFVLNGYVAPRPHPTTVHLLGNMHHLSTLEYDFLGKETWDDVRRNAHILTPAIEDLPDATDLSPHHNPIYSDTSLNVPSSRLDDLLLHLRSLVVSNPSSDDHFFRYLPSTLESLSVIALPPDGRGGHWRAVAPLSEERCFDMLDAISSIQLKKLHITHDAPVTTLSLLDKVVSVLPSLEVLYLEAAHYSPYSDEDVTDAYLSALEPLEMLRDLRISIPFHRTYTASEEDMEQMRENFAEQLASTLSELQLIGLRQDRTSSLQTFSYAPFYVWWVIRDEDDSVILEHDDTIADYS